jgi:hypothetical protein
MGRHVSECRKAYRRKQKVKKKNKKGIFVLAHNQICNTNFSSSSEECPSYIPPSQCKCKEQKEKQVGPGKNVPKISCGDKRNSEQEVPHEGKRNSKCLEKNKSDAKKTKLNKVNVCFNDPLHLKMMEWSLLKRRVAQIENSSFDLIKGECALNMYYLM